MFEVTSSSLTLIFRAMRSLPDFFEDKVFNLLNAWLRNHWFVLANTPNVVYSLNEVMIFLNWKYTVIVKVVVAETFNSYWAFFRVHLNAITKLLKYHRFLLLSG